jgi:hypothetical protein
VFSPYEDVGGVERGLAVSFVERPTSGEVAEDGVVAEIVMQEGYGRNDRSSIPTHTPSIGREHGEMSLTVHVLRVRVGLRTAGEIGLALLRRLGRTGSVKAGRPQQGGDERIVAEPACSNLGRATERLTFDAAARRRRQLGAGGVDGHLSGGDSFGEVASEAEPVFDQRLICDGNVNLAR